MKHLLYIFILILLCYVSSCVSPSERQNIFRHCIYDTVLYETFEPGQLERHVKSSRMDTIKFVEQFASYLLNKEEILHTTLGEDHIFQEHDRYYIRILILYYPNHMYLNNIYRKIDANVKNNPDGEFMNRFDVSYFKTGDALFFCTYYGHMPQDSIKFWSEKIETSIRNHACADSVIL